MVSEDGSYSSQHLEGTMLISFALGWSHCHGQTTSWWKVPTYPFSTGKPVRMARIWRLESNGFLNALGDILVDRNGDLEKALVSLRALRCRGPEIWLLLSALSDNVEHIWLPGKLGNYMQWNRLGDCQKAGDGNTTAKTTEHALRAHNHACCMAVKAAKATYFAASTVSSRN